MKNLNLKGSGLVGAVIVFFFLLFVYTKLFGPIPFSVQNTNTLSSTPFEVSGTGSASAVPDTAVIQIGVTQSGTTVEEAQNKTNQAVDDILNGLDEIGVDEKDIKTTNYSVRPEYSELGRTENITGYTVTQNIQVEAPIDNANQVIDVVTKKGANLVGGISYTLEDDSLEKLRNEAREEAVENAKKSAKGLAKASGISLGKIINVQESYSGGPVPIQRQVLTLDATTEESTPTNITPGESNIEVTITLTYQIN